MDLQHMENGIGGGGGGSGVGSNSNSQTLSEIDFQKLAQTIASSIQKIQQNVVAMQRMVNQCNTPQDSPDLKKQLHQIMTYTHQLVSDTSNQLKESEKCKERHLKIQRERLLDEFTAALTKFQALQRKTVNIEKDQVRQARANQYSISKPPGSTNNSSNGGNNSFLEDNLFGRKSQQQQQTQMQEDIDLQALEEQERAIRELEENIVGVNEIYKKLGSMVYEQGLVVDSIESSVEQTSVYVSQGTENLRMAGSYKNKLRKKKLILLGIVAVILLIVIIIIVLEFKH
ncbi:syntaxin-7 [Stomoxys calcitrans]|uniref:syntaxin-7 n=1 Tax=Stomoxys calcitrans TaxID=35570 RepID=UPI0027E2F070|nr:syntaxin-7 [Stomoxys calcitrans]XP_013114200.2 syntaxin-7 [Stomoxys calcitrans]XP_013114201.2 syntaxin-7 [Stomoxys calcitrans]